MAKSSETVNSIGFIIVFPLTFISSAFVPVASMPEGLRQFAEVNPFTIVVDALRHLWLGAPSNNDVLLAVVWSIGLIAVFGVLATARYRRAAAS
jgi:ABC-type multidrug transport system permease subunit